MQTLEKDWDCCEATIYTDGAAAHGNTNGVNGIIVITGHHTAPRAHRQCTIPAGKWCSTFHAEEDSCVNSPHTSTSGYLPPQGAHRFQIVCKHSNVYKICIHPRMLPTPMKKRFLTLCLRLLTAGAICGALDILISAATSLQTWLPKNGQLWSRKETTIIMTQRKRQYGMRLRNPLLPRASTSKEEKKLTTSWNVCQGRTKSTSAF